MRLVPLNETLGKTCERLFGAKIKMGLDPEHAYIGILSISSVMSLGHPDRKMLYDTLWTRLSYQMYAISEGSTLAWIAVAMQQNAYVRYDGVKLFLLEDTTIPMTKGLLQSIAHINGEIWTAEVCLGNFDVKSIIGTLKFIISHFQLLPAEPSFGFPSWSIYSSTGFVVHWSQTGATAGNVSSSIHCSACSRSFQDELKFRQHNVQVHHITPPISFNGYPQCWDCAGMPFATEQSLRNHDIHKHAYKSFGHSYARVKDQEY